MQLEEGTMIGIAVVVFFIWRFARTHQLYRYSLRVARGQIESTQFRPSFSRNFLNGALLGNRSVDSNSFFVRGLVYAVVALILLPFRDYAPELYWIVTILIIFYVPWCFCHGFLLGRKS
ncbi:MAG: hypothetical protein PVJ05_14530 [Candidatus Thorarchaeota archaeon]|jgi:hypothetical protein